MERWPSLCDSVSSQSGAELVLWALPLAQLKCCSERIVMTSHSLSSPFLDKRQRKKKDHPRGLPSTSSKPARGRDSHTHEI